MKCPNCNSEKISCKNLKFIKRSLSNFAIFTDLNGKVITEPVYTCWDCYTEFDIEIKQY